AGFRIGDRIELQVTDPFIRRLNALELESKDALVNQEHAIEHALVGKIHAKLVGIDGITLLLEFGAEMTPIPDMDVSVGLAGFLHLQCTELSQLCIELRLKPIL